MKVDHAKEANEKLLEKAVEVLSHTIPEQKVDAMKDYHKIMRTLEKGTDWSFKPILAKLQMLYMYPGRKLHNNVIVEIHELLEAVREKRINQMIENQRKKDLGEVPMNPVSNKVSSYWPLLLLLGVAVLTWPRN